MRYRRSVVLVSCYVGLMLWTGGAGASDLPAPPAADAPVPAVAVPPELRTWMAQTRSPRVLPPGSHPAQDSVDFLPPHAAQLFAAEATTGTPLILEVTEPRAYDVPVSERIHQLKANGELDDTTRCGLELPFPALPASAPRAGLKAVWNLLCRNRGGSMEYLGHTLRGSGPNPHRLFVLNGWKGYGPLGLGLRAQLLAPGDQKDNEMMGWLPWTRDQVETFYMYNMKQRRPRQGSTNRGDKMMGTYLTREQDFGWEGQFYVYDWELLGERPILTVLDSRHDFPVYLPPHYWFPDDQWILRSAFLVVGRRAHKGAGSGYIALWLDSATFEPLWTVSYTEEGIPQNILGLIFKWSGEHRRHVTIGKSTVDVDAEGRPIAGSVFEARWCSIVHHPEAVATPAAFNGQLLGKAAFNWSKRPAGCADAFLGPESGR